MDEDKPSHLILAPDYPQVPTRLRIAYVATDPDVRGARMRCRIGLANDVRLSNSSRAT